MEFIDNNSVELYNKLMEMSSEVDRKPKNIHLLVPTGVGQDVMPMDDIPLSSKDQHEALAAWIHEQEVLKEEYKNREVV